MADAYFRIELMPAGHGDAILVEYGKNPTRRMLIDAGPLTAFEGIEARLKELPQKGIELLVVTHVDTDHIEGVVRILAAKENQWLVNPKEVWFNGWSHLEDQSLGGREGEFMGALIRLRLADRWNRKFDGHAVSVGDGIPPTKELKGGLNLTLLSPDAKKLSRLKKDWSSNLQRWKILPDDLERALAQLASERRYMTSDLATLGPEDLGAELLDQLKRGDSSAANGSSIAFLARFGEKSCLFLADAHMNVVCASLLKLGYSMENPLKVNAVKMSHHGSKGNITKRFLELVDAENFLVSTNGDIHEHPDDAAIEAVIIGARRKPTIWFNYRNPFTQKSWEARAKDSGATFQVRYPDRGESGIILDL